MSALGAAASFRFRRKSRAPAAAAARDPAGSEPAAVLRDVDRRRPGVDDRRYGEPLRCRDSVTVKRYSEVESRGQNCCGQRDTHMKPVPANYRNNCS